MAKVYKTYDINLSGADITGVATNGMALYIA